MFGGENHVVASTAFTVGGTVSAAGLCMRVRAWPVRRTGLDPHQSTERGMAAVSDLRFWFVADRAVTLYEYGDAALVRVYYRPNRLPDAIPPINKNAKESFKCPRTN